MREEDKLLLLAEIIGVDTSKYVTKYIEELRSSNVFLELCKNVHRARNVDSYKAQLLIDEFETIDFNSVKTLKECFILRARINYLLTTSLESNYINPFFYNEESDLIEKVGEIVVNFDSKKYTLNDMILDERYTTNYKIDYVKDCYLEWRKEVVEKVVNPLIEVHAHEKDIPDVKIFDYKITLIMSGLIICNLVFIFMPFVPSHFIRSLYRQSANNLFIQIMFNIFISLLFINDIILIIVLFFKNKKNGKIIYAKNMIKNSYKIIKKVDKKCELFYAYLLKSLGDNKLLNKNIRKYALNKEQVRSISTLKNLLNKENKQVDEGIPFIMRLFLVLLLIISLILISYFVYLFWRKYS